MPEFSEQVERKFIDQIQIDNEWEIETDTGWEPITSINKTVKYQIYELYLDRKSVV